MSDRLRVGLHVGQLLQGVPGGIGRYVESLATHLPDVGVEVIAFAAGARPAGLPERIVYCDLGPPRGALRYELWHRARRPRLHLDRPVDLIHAPSLAVPPTGTTPLVVTVHDLAFRRTPETLTPHGVRFHERGFARASSGAQVLVVASEFSAGELEAEGITRDRIVVARHGIEPIAAADDETVDAHLATVGVRAPFVLSVGTVEPRKQLPVAVGALARIRALAPEFELVIAGPAGWGTVGGLDTPGVRRLGAVSPAVLDALYRRATATLLPSRYEGFGLPALEAMARGCPPVVPPDGALAEVVGAGGAIRPATAEAFAEIVMEWIADPGARATLGAAGRARAAEFSIARSVEAHLQAYERALQA